jgi:hypothetical protein
MDCVKAQEHLHPYIDNALPAAFRRELEQHLQSCPKCNDELTQLRALSRALRSLPQAELPPGFTRDLHNQLATEPKPKQPALMRRGWARALAAAAMLVLVIGVVALGSDVLNGAKFAVMDNQLVADEAYYASTPVIAPAPTSSPTPAASPPDSPYLSNQSAVPDEAAYYNYDMVEEEAVKMMGIVTETSGEMPAEMFTGTSEVMAAPEMTVADAKVERNDSGIAAPDRAAGGSAAGQQLERKIIRNADLSLKVDDFDFAYQRLNDMAGRYGGYVVSGQAYGYEGEKMQSGFITLRVDAGRLDEALAEIEGLGKVENRNISAQDITMEYYDIAGRLGQYRIQEQRLLDILSKAEIVEDLIKVESELTRVRSQLESLNGQLRYFDQMTALSSISINLYQRDQNTQIVRLSGWPGLWQDIRESFIGGVNALIRGASSLAIGLARLLPLLLLIALVLTALLLLILRRRRR